MGHPVAENANDTNPRQTSRSDDEEEERRPILHIGGLWVTMEVIQLAAAFVISILVLIGCFWVILAPTDDRTEQGALAIATAVVTAWVTKFAGQVFSARR